MWKFLCSRICAQIFLQIFAQLLGLKNIWANLRAIIAKKICFLQTFAQLLKKKNFAYICVKKCESFLCILPRTGCSDLGYKIPVVTAMELTGHTKMSKQRHRKSVLQKGSLLCGNSSWPCLTCALPICILSMAVT